MEYSDRDRSQGNRPPALRCFRSANGPPIKGATNGERAPVKVNIRNFKTQQLPYSQSRYDPKSENSSCRFRQRPEQPSDFIRAEHRHLAGSIHWRQLDSGRGVVLHHTPRLALRPSRHQELRGPDRLVSSGLRRPGSATLRGQSRWTS